MPILVELNLDKISVDEISVDESLFPDKMKDFYIYEHLRYYCSKFDPLPAIAVRVFDDSAYVIHGHQYLSIAKDLKRSHIRAIIDKSSSEESIKVFLQKPSVIQLDWVAARNEEYNTLVTFNWYVFFFERPLTLEEKVIFEDQLVGFFKQLELPKFAENVDERIKNLNYSYSGLCAEFQAFVPVADERWYGKCRSVMIKFHLECVHIISFQGSKFLIT